MEAGVKILCFKKQNEAKMQRDFFLLTFKYVECSAIPETDTANTLKRQTQKIYRKPQKNNLRFIKTVI